MSKRAERLLIVYFRALALSCSAPKRSVQRLLTAYLALVLGDMAVQLWRYCGAGWLPNNIHLQNHRVIRYYVRSIDVMKVAYLLTHLLIVAQALIWRNWERGLFGLLPHTQLDGSQLNVRFHLALEGIISCGVLLPSITSVTQLRDLAANLPYFFSIQAVRARYLQMALFVMRLDTQLQRLQLELGRGGCQMELRARYAHLVRLSAHISRFFGLSILLMNLLCIGDVIAVCYSYIILWQFGDTMLGWMLLRQTVYVLFPALVKIWTLCAACHKCANHVGPNYLSLSVSISLSLFQSQQLQLLLNADCQQKRSRCRTSTSINMAASRNGTNEFALQIMQNPVHFSVCGIYNINLNTLAGVRALSPSFIHISLFFSYHYL